jgi:type II secretory pathway component GspD/PulD (secretin)
MARKYIGGTLSGGVMVLCMILLFTPETHGQSAKRVMFTISGSVGQPSVTMQGLPGGISSNENGVYTVQVPYGWSGTVTPVKAGFTFEPKQKIYKELTENKTTEDYQATLQTFVIAGSTGKPGVTLRGLPEDPISDPNGRYSVTVPYGWSGTVAPEKEGFRFDPASKPYNQVAADMKSESYAPSVMTFPITGNVGVDGVIMKGLPGDPKTSGGGLYKAEVEYNWNGTVTPIKEGYEFMPKEMPYTAVTQAQTDQDYTARIFTFEISGSTGMAGVVMAGLPGEPITDADGAYRAVVDYGKTFKVTPTKAGYTFDPPSRDYTAVKASKDAQDYKATIMKYKIAGTAGVGGAKMVGLPGDVVSGPTGSYTATLEYGATATIAPEKEGYTFEPATLMCGPLEKDLAKQDFKAKAMTFTISGNVELPGVELKGLPGRVISGQDGSYTVDVGYKWTGSATPTREGYSFEPARQDYKDVLEAKTGENYKPTIKTYVISGRITSDKGAGVSDIFIMTDKGATSVATDSTGEFKLTVDHGWTGKISPLKPGCSFNPGSRPVGPVAQNVPATNFTATIKMMSITDAIKEGDEPIQGVTITAQPTGATATTDAKGKYSIQVPYDWTGDLIPEKKGFIFDPPKIPYANVTQSIDKTATLKTTTGPEKTPTGPEKITPPPEKTPAGPGKTAAGPGKTAAGPGKTATGPGKTGAPVEPNKPPTEKEKLEQDLAAIRDKIAQLENKGGQGTTTRPEPVPVISNALVSGTFQGSLLEVLRQISLGSGVNIGVDGTVKPTIVPAVSFDRMPIASALQGVLKGTQYIARVDASTANTYIVYKSISQTFAGDELRQALQDLSSTAGVPIIPEDTVTGQVWADLVDVPLERALEIILSGTPCVVKKYPDYYLVADRKPDSSAFPKISETQRVRLNYIAPTAAKGLLSSAFTPYVQAELDPNSHIVTVTAPPEIANRIVSELKGLDIRPKHVLLDARIVAMERGNLLNLGVEWNFPTIRGGVFTDSFVKSNTTEGQVTTDAIPYGLQVGFSFDRTFTDSLSAALNLLRQNQQADILSSPQVMGQDGKRSRIQVITEEYYVLTPPAVSAGLFYAQSQFETVKSGTTLEITPRIGDNNDITLELSVEVSDSVPRGQGTDLPVVTRRTAQNSVVIKDGGTVAVAGLTENRSRAKEKRVPWASDLPLIGPLFRNNEKDKGTREIAVFVTAYLVPENGQVTGRSPEIAGGTSQMGTPAQEAFRQQLRESVTR